MADFFPPLSPATTTPVTSPPAAIPLHLATKGWAQPKGMGESTVAREEVRVQVLAEVLEKLPLPVCSNYRM